MGESHTYGTKWNETYQKFLPPAAGMGRPKGSPNKIKHDIKTMVFEALERVGGTLYLMEQAHANPVAFMGLVGKVLPLQVVGSGPNGEVQINIQSISWQGNTAQSAAPITINSTDYSARTAQPAAITSRSEPLPTDDARTRVPQGAQLRKAVKP